MKKDYDHLKAIHSDRKPVKLPPLLCQVKDNSISILLAHLENLFASCDDLFFDLSSRATSNNEQNLYFESMREIRLRKNGVISKFKTEIDSGFQLLPTKQSANAKASKEAATPIHANNLSLVQNDILEQDVAISSMVTKARANCQESLYQLKLRFDYLIPENTITEHNNPLDPQQICKYFAEACNLLELNIKARIILFKQFDRVVVSKLATIYSSANTLLVEAGVLPNTQDYIKKKSDSGAASNAPAYEQQFTEFEFTELSNLLDNIRRHDPAQLSRLIPNYTAYSTNPGPLVPNNELVQLLTSIHQGMSTLQASQEELALAENLRQIIGQILSSSDNQPDKSLQQPDDDVINLVAMFFDFVLDDRNLPVPAQAMISRLQIPVLKIALRDKTFFSNGNHPARKLINAIADTTLGWDESTQPEKDKLYSLLASITLEINDHYTNNDQIFAEKLQEVQAFADQLEHKSKLITKRTEQAAEGQAKTKLAKLMAQSVTYEKLETAALPEVISEFLTSHWLNLLVMTHLKYGDESAEWVDAVQLIDDLIWASQRHEDNKSRTRYEKIKPHLLSRIKSGLQQISATSEDASELLNKLQLTLDQLYSEEANPSWVARPLSAAQAQKLGHTPGGGSKNWKDMTGLERQQARYKQLSYDNIRKAEQLPLNTWLSYTDPKTGAAIRCKLAARIEASDSYIFVNRFGFKALEKQRKDFACDMQAGRAVIIEKSNLFDRAMNKVFTRLNNPGSAESAPS